MERMHPRHYIATYYNDRSYPVARVIVGTHPTDADITRSDLIAARKEAARVGALLGFTDWTLHCTLKGEGPKIAS